MVGLPCEGIKMPRYSKNSGYGQFIGPFHTTGKVFMVAGSTDPNYNAIQEIWTTDPDGVTRLYSTLTLALAACTAGRGDKILVSPNYTTAPTLANLATAATKGVVIEQAGKYNPDGSFVVQESVQSLPATTSSSIFTVTAPIRILDLVGEVVTVVQTQACSLLFCSIPTVGDSVNLCTNVSINAAAVGTTINITGTLASAANLNANGVFVAQAAPVVVPAGTIKVVTSATNSGSLKYLIRYQSIAPGARVFAA